MIAFDPDEIVVFDSGTDFQALNTGAEKAVAALNDNVNIHQKWGMTIPKMGGTAYIRITPQLRDFFKLCHEKHGVIGFEYDFDEAGLNFGLVLKEEQSNAG